MKVLGVIALVAVCIGLVLLLDYSSLLWEGFISPKRQAVRRKVFLETRSYNEAKLQELIKYRHEYMTAESDQDKKALAFTIRHTFAEYDENKLPSELKQFLSEIKYKY